MTLPILTQPLTAGAFAPYGDVIAAEGEPTMMINRGMCGRHHDLAALDFSGADARAGISLFRAVPRSFPYELDMMERHPEGSQAFLPMTDNPFLVIVAADKDGAPHEPEAFVTRPGQGVNYHRNIWHHPLLVLEPQQFVIIDRAGDGQNCDEQSLDMTVRLNFD